MAIDEKIEPPGNDQSLENRVNQDQGREQPESGLEQKANQGFLKILRKFSLWDWTKIGAVGLGAAFFSGARLYTGIRSVATTMFSYALGRYLADKKGITRKRLKNEFLLGAYISPLLYSTYSMVARIANPILKTGAGLAF